MKIAYLFVAILMGVVTFLMLRGLAAEILGVFASVSSGLR